jgi:hypothetical protein
MAAFEAATPQAARAQSTRRGPDNSEPARGWRRQEGAASKAARGHAAILKDAQSLAAASKVTGAKSATTEPTTTAEPSAAAKTVATEAAMATAMASSTSTSTSY